MRCLKEKLENHIKVIEVGENFKSLKSIVNTISNLESIADPVSKLSKFLTTKLFGVSVLSLLGTQTGGIKGTIIKTTIKGFM